jgi:peptide/nickel transport system substrate-binding protein/oligopeptide transport system substrate-binding protein
VQFDHTLTVVPALARFWKASRDARTWTFTLRSGVRFHHGREVTADDVVFSLTRLLDPATQSGAADLFSNISGAREFREGRTRTVKGLVALDQHTVQITLDDADFPFVSALAVGHAKIVPRDVVEQQGPAFGRHPVGTGPFRFERWEPGRAVVLAANADYFDEPPRIAQLVYRVFKGEQLGIMFEEFRQGRLEDCPVPTQEAKEVIASGAYAYVKRPMISLRLYGLNTRVKPLNDVRVRQAVIHAIDREGLLEDLFPGRYVFARGILPPGMLGFNPKLRGAAYAPDRSRALLAEAGHAGGRGLPPLAIWSSVRHEGAVREQERIRRALGAVGIGSELHYETDWPAFSRRLEARELPVFLYAWYADVPDPDNFLKLFHSRNSRNFFGYANPQVDALLAQAQKEHDALQRVELYRKAEQMILTDAPLVPIMHHTYERLFQSYVRNVEVSGLGDAYIPLRKVSLESPR